MPAKDARSLDVLVTTYDDPGDAAADVKALRELYKRLGSSYNFDAAVVRKTAEGEVRLEKSYEAGRRHVALNGLGFGLAAGTVAAVFPEIGVAAAALAGGAGGAAIGAIVGHVRSGVSRHDLMKIGDLLHASEVALVVVYETSLADRIMKNVKGASRVMGRLADLDAVEITAEIEHG